MPPKRTTKKAAPKKKAPARKTKADNNDEVEMVKVVERKKTGFLDLAAELRNEIYDLALARPWDISIPDRKEAITTSTKAGKDLPPVVLHEPALLATCHEVHNEALAVFYGINTFAMKYALYGVKLVEQLGPDRTAMLKALKPCGTEQMQYVTSDRWSHVTICHVNRLFEAAHGALSADAVLMPIGYGAREGWEKLTDSTNHRVVGQDGEVVVEWTGSPLEPAFSIYDY